MSNKILSAAIFATIVGLIAIVAIANSATPAAAQYSPNDGGNCARPLIPWRGAHMPCDGYGPRQQYRGHGGQTGSRQIVVQPFIYLESRTCRDWVMRNGVKVTTRVYAC